MAVVELVARVHASVEQLVCHPRLPLVAGLAADRPAVHIWDCTAGELRDAGTLGGDAAVYRDGADCDRRPAAAWHPHQPLLLVAVEGDVAHWTPAGLGPSDLRGLPAAAAYRNLAFSPDGRTLWASPSSSGEDDLWESSDVLDLASGLLEPGPPWDTGVAAHPAGRLVATLCSDQASTLVLFARIDQGDGPAVMRVLRKALFLDADGYETPIFSPDGRHIAIRGNAHENTLDVFEFPSLDRVLATTLGEPSPGYPYPDEWLERMRAWSRHNIAFGRQPGVLWIGTPRGTLVEVGLDDQQVVEHDVLPGSPVTGLGVMATGELVVAGGGGDLAIVSVLAGEAEPDAAAGETLGALVTAFLATTSEVPDDGDPQAHLVVTDGARTWEPADLATATTATTADPAWLRLRAAANACLLEHPAQDS